jgi:putative oxidoreductase
VLNRLLWVLQVGLGLYFIVVGVIHLVVPEGLPEFVSWMYDMTRGQHIAAGTLEILGGLGLILPGLTGIKPDLTIWAALGLMAVMVAAAIWHVGRGELASVGANAVNIAALAVIVYGRSRLAPFPPARS